ncbi:MAG: site-2 protease family protein [Firmicutes bacterium]|nr:site-2 protease family protein [Bacillota bacterium]MCL1953932.1 site-2 protease family protein [Bacillota bacterium]
MRLKVSPLVFIMGFVMFVLGLGVEFVAFMLVIIVHEFSHAHVAERLGYQLHILKLMPYGASLTGNFETIKCRDEIKIAIAGPAINLILAICIASIWWFFISTYEYSEILLYANLGLFLLNLLPIYPFDGGRILLAILAQKYSRARAFRVFRWIGIVFSIFALIFSGFAIYYGANLSIGIIAGFIFFSSIFPENFNRYHRLYSMAYRIQKIEMGVQLKEIVVSCDTTLIKVFRMLHSNYYHRFSVVKNGQIIGFIWEHQLEDIAVDKGVEIDMGQAVNINKGNL